MRFTSEAQRKAAFASMGGAAFQGHGAVAATRRSLPSKRTIKGHPGLRGFGSLLGRSALGGIAGGAAGAALSAGNPVGIQIRSIIGGAGAQIHTAVTARKRGNRLYGKGTKEARRYRRSTRGTVIGGLLAGGGAIPGAIIGTYT